VTVREAVDAVLRDTKHMGNASTDPEYSTWAQRGALFLQQGIEYTWDYDDWDFKMTSASLSVSANAGRVEASANINIEGPHGGLYVSGQQREIVWIPARELFAERELLARSGSYPELYTVAQQSSSYLPYLYFDRTTHDAFTGVHYYLKTRPTVDYVPIPGACSDALAGGGAGNVENGVHSYKVTFVTAQGETEAGTVSDGVTVVDKTVNGKVALTAIPTATYVIKSTTAVIPAVTSRKIYRTTAGGSTYLLLATLSDNTTTTYTDNIADASLGAAAPSTDSTGDALKQIPSESHRSLLLEFLRYMLRENVGDQRAEVANFPLFTTALQRMKTQRTFGLQEVERFGDRGAYAGGW
jgi:hypothetical protein